jgi:hypothetical protein
MIPNQNSGTQGTGTQPPLQAIPFPLPPLQAIPFPLPPFVYIPPIPTPPAGTYGYAPPANPQVSSALAGYGLPSCCPFCGMQNAFAPRGGAPQFRCGYPVGNCINTSVTSKIEVEEEPTGCICHITILVSRGCQSARGLPCPSRKK